MSITLKEIFVCFFWGPKKAGATDFSFLEAIHGSLICLFVIAIDHCLKQWATGSLDDCDDMWQQLGLELGLDLA